MMDNLRAHLPQRMFDAAAGEGHRLLRRPVASPDFAPVESVFSEMKASLRRASSLITPRNLAGAAQAALRAIPQQHFANFFLNCGY